MTGKTYTLRNWRYYYDRETRSWWAYRVDANGDQDGDAIFDFSKPWIVRAINAADGVAA